MRINARITSVAMSIKMGQFALVHSIPDQSPILTKCPKCQGIRSLGFNDRMPFRNVALRAGLGGCLERGHGVGLLAFGRANWPLAIVHSDPLWV